MSPFCIRQHVVADGVGPGLDGKRDEAMFILIEMELPQPYQVVLFDNESGVTARSAWTNRIYNRLYIGQFEELRHLKDDQSNSLIKAIPCSRVFSFLDKIGESLFIFIWEGSERLRNTDFLNCNLIFTLRFHSDRNNWNPFKSLWQGNWEPFKDLLRGFHRDLTLELGIHIKNESIYPWFVWPLNVSQVLTKEVADDLIKYT